MASIKVKFRPSTKVDREGTIYYQIIHNRRVSRLTTRYHLHADEWDENISTVAVGCSSSRNSFLLSIREYIRYDIERLVRIIHKLDKGGLPYSSDDVINEFTRYSDQYTLFNFMKDIIAGLRQNGRVRTSETYSAALSSFKKFRCEEDLMLDNLNSTIVETYEAWLKQRGVSLNTISFYTRILRAVYNRAVEKEIIENRNPFRHVYTGIDKTVKRALPLSLIKKIHSLDLTGSPTLDYARDMFILSFMLRGMSLIDMAFLRKTDFCHNYITYRRKKTGQLLTIAWTKEMQRILNKYPENSSGYLLPIIRKSDISERSAYRNAGYKINRNLKIIARRISLTIPLTLYVARHSWASIAKAKGIPLSVISEGMGHDSEATTQIYLASLDTSLVDRANALILKSLD